MSAVCIWFGFDLGLSCKLLWYKGSPALRKAVTAHVEKTRQFFTRVWSRGQPAETYHSPFSPLCHTDERTAKLSCTILKQTSFVGWVFLGLWLLKHWKIRIAYRQWRSKVSRRGRKPNYEEKNRVMNSVALVTSFSFSRLRTEIDLRKISRREVPYLPTPMYYSLFITWVHKVNQPPKTVS